MLRSLLTLMLASALGHYSQLGSELRLVSGSDSCCGRVEILHNGMWGTVCDDDWDMSDAGVVCRQSNCGTTISAPQGAAFGQGSGEIWLYNIRCFGNESNLNLCSHRDSAVSPGENIQFRCTTPNPRCLEEAEFRKGLTTASSQRHLSSVNFSLAVDILHQRQYSCDYSNKNDSTNSSRIKTIDIIVVNLQQPNISLWDLGGLFNLGPQKPVVTRGHNFTILCFTKSQYPGGSFKLFSRTNIIRNQSVVKHFASFFFPEADYSHQGNYSCVYEVNVFSRTFHSDHSDLLVITIEASLHPVIGAVVSLLTGLGLLAAFIIILLMKRRKHHKNKETQKSCFFLQANVHSNVVDEDRYEEEEEENDYVNAKCVDEEDYVNLNVVESNVSSDESEKDYVNVNIPD